MASTIRGVVRRARKAPAQRCREKFLRIFPGGFRDPEYLELERDYKWQAHQRWRNVLGPEQLEALVQQGRYSELAGLAIGIESRTNLLFSFEKMALRDAVRSRTGARQFALGLQDFLYGHDDLEGRFARWCATIGTLPRRQTRVLTWPLVTVFGFIAEPKQHIFFKPRVTQTAATAYGFDLNYRSQPGWSTYTRVLEFADRIRRDNRDLRPRDYIDLQSFIWVQGSDEYEE